METWTAQVYTRVSVIAPWIAKNVDSIDCEDDVTWRSTDNEPCHSADLGSKKKCKKTKDANGVRAKLACPKSCGEC